MTLILLGGCGVCCSIAMCVISCCTTSRVGERSWPILGRIASLAVCAVYDTCCFNSLNGRVNALCSVNLAIVMLLVFLLCKHGRSTLYHARSNIATVAQHWPTFLPTMGYDCGRTSDVLPIGLVLSSYSAQVPALHAQTAKRSLQLHNCKYGSSRLSAPVYFGMTV